ncbi:beta-glucoside-specific PTS transporter subunit IIABC [uncultured Agathobaculum sp.]|uniref:beta-glucoside-specific PTS transporter subunit IIABC n=1 Tax=uncultured Agathobaculum sp. TaxID=2048140 RepID=UPI003208510F
MLEKEAKELLALVGGKENVNQLVHCATRLRFELKDESLAQKKEIEAKSYVLSVVISGGQYQIVIGPQVTEYFAAIMQLLNLDESKKSDEGKKKLSIMKIISGAFSPLIPLLAGAGMIKALLMVLVEFGLLSDASSTYAILSAAGNSVFYFMPIFLGITLSKQFGGNMYVGGAIGAALLEPSFTSLIGQEGVNFLGISVVPVDYATTVFPIFIISFVYAFLDKQLRKIVKQELQMFLVPMICLLVLVPMAILVFGPFGTTIGNLVSSFISMLFDFNNLLAGLVLGATYPFLTILGLHWGFTPITLQNLSQVGGDVLEGAAVCCVYAEIGIAIGAYLKGRKGSKIREIAGPTILTGFLAGVTEPILYGIVMRYKRLMAIVAIAGGIGGAINGLCHVTMNAYVFHNLFSVAMMTYSPFVPFLIGCAAALAAGLLLTYFWGIPAEDSADFQAPDAAPLPQPQQTSQEMQPMTIATPANGTVIALEQVEDEAFAQGAVGKGAAILPADGKIYAPADGQITMVFPTKHALGMQCANGLELLIHVGLNTVELKGKYFTVHVKDGDTVKKGQLLLECDIEQVRQAGYPLTTPVLVTNADQLEVTCLPTPGTQVTVGDAMLEVKE